MKTAGDTLTHHIGEILEEGAFKNVLIICLKDYALEAIKADRERIKEHFEDCEYADHVIERIDNLPIEL